MPPLLAALLRRLLHAALVLLAVAAIAFAMFQFVGDPVVHMLGPEAMPEERARLRSDLGLDRPVPLQFVRFVAQAVEGDFGISLRQGRPVADLVAEGLPATLELAGAAALIALGVGLPLGVYVALHRGRWLAETLMALSLVGVSLPTFVVGILLILVFSVQLGWLPSFGRKPLVEPGGWRHLLLPALTLALFQLTLTVRLVRAQMLEVLGSDFIRFARARGLSPRAVHYRHALRNTLVPVITVAGLQLGTLIAFSIVTETVFQWPGLGLLFVQAIQFSDIPVMAAYLCLVALIFVAINFVVDLLVLAVDPRLRA